LIFYLEKLISFSSLFAPKSFGMVVAIDEPRKIPDKYFLQFKKVEYWTN